MGAFARACALRLVSRGAAGFCAWVFVNQRTVDVAEADRLYEAAAAAGVAKSRFESDARLCIERERAARARRRRLPPRGSMLGDFMRECRREGWVS